MYPSPRRLKYENRFLDFLYKHYLINRKRLKKLNRYWKKFVNWGHQSVTLMFIPHSVNKGVYSIHISRFMSAFILLVLGVLIWFAIRARNDAEFSHPRIRELTQQTEELNRVYNAFREQSRTLLSHGRELTGSLLAFSRMLLRLDRDHLEDFFELEPDEEAAPEDLRRKYNENLMLPEEAAGLADVKRILDTGRNQMERLRQFLYSIRPYIRLSCFSVYSRPVISWIPTLWPVLGGGGKITSPFGQRYNPFTGSYTKHTGADIAWKEGVYIKAAAPGRVLKAHFQGSYGLVVTIRHRNGYMTRYAHLDDNDVFEGDLVYQGQLIGTMGNTGRSTGPHLHYEVIEHGEQTDPEDFLIHRYR